MKANFPFLPVLLFGLLAALLPGFLPGVARAAGEDELPAGVKSMLDKAESIELYSLDPEPKGVGKGEKLHGWAVLGKATVKGKDLEAIVKAVEGAVGKGRGAKCFLPRHAIRVTSGGKTADLLICFECEWVYVYEGGKKTADPTVSNVQPVLDRVLKAAGVPLPGK